MCEDFFQRSSHKFTLIQGNTYRKLRWIKYRRFWYGLLWGIEIEPMSLAGTFHHVIVFALFSQSWMMTSIDNWSSFKHQVNLRNAGWRTLWSSIHEWQPEPRSGVWTTPTPAGGMLLRTLRQVEIWVSHEPLTRDIQRLHNANYCRWFHFTYIDHNTMKFVVGR